VSVYRVGKALEPSALYEPWGRMGGPGCAYLGQLSDLQVEANDERIPANPEDQPGCILGKAEVDSGWGLGEWGGDESMETARGQWGP
jgi:hypothetical protein